jgi:Prophage CP4-57 regulatory protein (AlpA)
MSLVTYKYLEAKGIIPNRMTLARSIEQYGFPKPIELGKNRIAWRLEEIEEWLASRPRRRPKCGAKKPEIAADASVVGAAK